MQHPLLYEINTRCWLAELSARAGSRITLADIPDPELDSFQRCGFTHVWLMGVWTLGTMGREHSRTVYAHREAEFGCGDITGSPYAIADYSVCPELGGDSGLEHFRHNLHLRGIKLVLDFVPNHTAIDHPWARQHPDYYVTSDAERAGTLKPYHEASKWFGHGWDGYGDPWIDTLQLNYRNPSLRHAMREELQRVAERCDGVRCDMAMLALNDVVARVWGEFPHEGDDFSSEFWVDAIGAVRRKQPEFLFLAEVYWDLEQRLQDLGFDFTYDKRLYDLLVARDAIGAASYVRSLPADFIRRSAHFLENHDEKRIASLLSWEEHRAAALLIMALPGMRFIHEGQMSGARVHANVHFARRGVEQAENTVAEFYQTLLEALQTSAVGNGEGKVITPQPAWADNPSHANFILLQWQQSPEAFDLAVIQMAAHRSQCLAPLDVESLVGGNWRFRDLLGNETFERQGEELARQGLYLDLPPHAAQLFHAERFP